ncbi:hypothetical protein OKN36_15520 [Furfurilactobacillus sp. OKN36]
MTLRLRSLWDVIQLAVSVDVLAKATVLFAKAYDIIKKANRI